MKFCLNFQKKPVKMDPFRWSFYFLAFLIIAELASNVVFAADVDGVAIPAVEGVHRSQPAQTLKPGQVGIALESRSSSAPLADEAFSDLDGQTVKLQKHSVTTGFGLTSFMDFHLGINGVNQKMSADVADELFADEMTTSEFTGVTGLLKFKLIDSGRFSLALAPFAESGSGAKGKNSVARSSQAKAGWMSLLSFGEPGIVTADLQFGYRYRSTETVGDLRLRNEMFYGAAVTGYVHRAVGLFVAGQGRSIQASRDSEHIGGAKREYKGLNASEVTGGLSLRSGEFTVTGFGGQRLEDSGLGYGQKIVGVKLAYSFGEEKPMWGGSTRISEDKDESKEVIADLDKAITEDNTKKDAAVEPEEPVVEIKEYDIYGDIEKETAGFLSPEAQKNDHVLLKEEMDREAKDPANQGPSEEEIRNRELEKLQSAEEARLQQEREAKRLAELENQRTAAERLEEENRRYNELKGELGEELEDLPEFETIDMDWE